MRKLFTFSFALLLALGGLEASAQAAPVTKAVLKFAQEQGTENRRVMTVQGTRRRRARGDRPRRRGIGGSFAEAGRSAGRGGKRLGQNVADGRPVRGGKEFGKGMGGFGKHVGKGTGKIGKRVGQSTKRALTP